MINKISHATALCVLAALAGCACPPPSPGGGPQLVVVKGSLTTTANNGSAGQGVNSDVVGGPVLSLSKIKRYTVTLHTAALSTVPAGVDKVEVHVGVLQGTTSYDVRVLQQDPATASPFPYPGFTVLPYTGTGSYIRVLRGADGLGPVEIRFVAFVEVEP